MTTRGPAEPMCAGVSGESNGGEPWVEHCPGCAESSRLARETGKLLAALIRIAELPDRCGEGEECAVAIARTVLRKGRIAHTEGEASAPPKAEEPTT
jgi:hypothetical protein